MLVSTFHEICYILIAFEKFLRRSYISLPAHLLQVFVHAIGVVASFSVTNTLHLTSEPLPFVAVVVAHSLQAFFECIEGLGELVTLAEKVSQELPRQIQGGQTTAVQVIDPQL